MTNSDIVQRRLHAQRMAGNPLDDPAQVVGWFGAVQSQDYSGAKWSLGTRTAGFREADIDALYDDGAILRTHVMRPTWHFVLPEDIRWMQALTGPRVKRMLATYDRQLGVDASVLARSRALMVDALKGGSFMIRPELMAVLQKAGINTEGTQRSAHLVMHAELDAVICSGPRRGKQFTYALVEERAPQARTLGRDESLAELALRFFTSHGPATIKDYAWWSGLTVSDARQGIALCGSRLVEETFGGVSRWLGADASPAPPVDGRAHLLPNYDEYVVAYVERGEIIDNEALHQLDPRRNLLFSHTLLVDGRVIGAWKRTLKKREALVELKTLTPPSPEQAAAIEAALARYGEFLGMPVVLA